MACALAYVDIPDGSLNGYTPLPVPPSGYAFQSQYCGAVLGLQTLETKDTAIICRRRVSFLPCWLLTWVSHKFGIWCGPEVSQSSGSESIPYSKCDHNKDKAKMSFSCVWFLKVPIHREYLDIVVHLD